MTKANECGRSMVEMLGVLAIIGVLSIGGVMGFHSAMEKAKANDVTEGVSERSVVLIAQAVQQSGYDLHEFDSQINGEYGIEIVPDTGRPGAVGLRVSDLPSGVCSKIAGIEAQSPLLAVEGDTSCATENNALLFVYDTSGAGLVDPNAIDERGCPLNKPVLTANGKCIACPTSFSGDISFSAATAEDCAKCSFNGQPYKYSGTTCYMDESCPEGYFYLYQSGKCTSCLTEAYTHHQTHEQNLECVESCNGLREITYDGGWGESCDRPCVASGGFYDAWGTCQHCENVTGYWGSASCNKCPGLTFVNVTYYDRCELLSNCPEGQHIGKCCEPGEVWNETGSVTGYSNGQHYPKGICCPGTRPTYVNGKCEQSSS